MNPMDPSSPECQVCMAGVASCVFHCGHALCPSCVTNIGTIHPPPEFECPMCRRPVVQRPIVFLDIDKDPVTTNQLIDALWAVRPSPATRDATAVAASLIAAANSRADAALVTAAEATAAASAARSTAIAAFAAAATAEANRPLSHDSLLQLAIANFNETPVPEHNAVVQVLFTRSNAPLILETALTFASLPFNRFLHPYTRGPVFIVIKAGKVFAKEETRSRQGLRVFINLSDGEETFKRIAAVEADAVRGRHRATLRSELRRRDANGSVVAHWWIKTNATETLCGAALALMCIGVERTSTDVACTRWHVVGMDPNG